MGYGGREQGLQPSPTVSIRSANMRGSSLGWGAMPQEETNGDSLCVCHGCSEENGR